MKKKSAEERKTVHAVIESIEEGIAILETDDRTQYEVPKSRLPEACHTGHHLQVEIEDGVVVSSAMDEEATTNAKVKVEAMMSRLRRGDHLKNRK